MSEANEPKLRRSAPVRQTGAARPERRRGGVRETNEVSFKNQT